MSDLFRVLPEGNTMVHFGEQQLAQESADEEYRNYLINKRGLSPDEADELMKEDV